MNINWFILVNDWIVIMLLLGLLIWDKIRFDRRERDLIDRCMARDFGEYVTGSTRLTGKAPDGKLTVEEAVDALAEEGVLADEARQPSAVIRVQ